MSKARDLANAGTALTSVSATELGYVDGVTSAIQTQIDSKIGQANAINPTIVDAKGDIIAATAADTVARLAVGSNDQVLTADSSTATGLKWAAPAAGGITLISETVASANSSLSLSSIPSTYKDLLITWSGIYHSGSGNRFQIRFNNDSSTIYSLKMSYYNAGTFSVYSGDSESGVSGSSFFAPFGNGASSSILTEASQGFLIIENYASTSKYKNYRGEWRFFEVGSGERTLWNLLGIYKTTTAISSIDVVRLVGSGTFSNASNTSIRLYGVS